MRLVYFKLLVAPLTKFVLKRCEGPRFRLLNHLALHYPNLPRASRSSMDDSRVSPQSTSSTSSESLYQPSTPLNVPSSSDRQVNPRQNAVVSKPSHSFEVLNGAVVGKRHRENITNFNRNILLFSVRNMQYLNRIATFCPASPTRSLLPLLP